MEITKKDIAEVGQAVENLGRLVEEQLQQIQQKLSHLSHYSVDCLSQLKGIQTRLAVLETELEETREGTEELALFRQELGGVLRNLEQIMADLQELRPKSDKPE